MTPVEEQGGRASRAMVRRGLAVAEVVPLQVTIERDEVLRFLGYPEGVAPPRRIDDLLYLVLDEARTLARPRGVFLELGVERSRDIGLEPLEASALVIGLVTAGDEIEKRAKEILHHGSATQALLLDTAGSAAAEEAADRLGAIIAGTAEQDRSHHVSCRVSPGYGRWPLTAQQLLFDLLPHGRAGVELLPSMLMVPRKSVSFAMWMGAEGRPLAGLSGCARCELEQCRYRRPTKGSD